MNGFAATLLTVSLFLFITTDAMAQLQPIDAGDPVTLSATDNPAFITTINGINHVVSRQADGTYVMHGEDGSFRTYPDIDFIRNVEGRYASFGSLNANQNGPVRLDLVTGDLFESPPAITTGLDGTIFELRPALTDGIDVSGGLAFQVAGANSAFSCPGFSESLPIPEIPNGLFNITAGAAIDCNLGVVGSIVSDFDSSHFQFYVTRDFTDTSSVYSALGVEVAVNNIIPASRPTFMKIEQTVFDTEYSVLMQGHNADDIAYLYNGSDASLTPMQAGERFIALVDSGAVAIDSTGECIFVDGDFNRVPLTSNGAPYADCVDATQVDNKLAVTTAGSVVIYYHELEETQSPVCIDTDGDGWGWDGSQTCVVEPTVQPVAGICIDSDGDGYGWNGVASCIPEPPCIDTDGDGWGWTGTESCLIDFTNGPVDESIFTTLPCIDNDNDGWGWKEPPGRPDLGRSCAIN